jgi:hypothetical protein
MRYDINRMGEQINYVYGELLAQIVTAKEYAAIKKLKVGESVTFPRNFGTQQPLIVKRVE